MRLFTAYKIFQQVAAVLTISSLMFIWIAIEQISSTQAFFPTNFRSFLVGGGETHQSLTESALKELYQEFFSITKITRPMKKAMEQIKDANADVDDDQVSSRKHFDGENFQAGQNYVLTELAVMKLALKDSDANGARTALGHALHAIQDFYAHSNWVELGNTTIQPALGRPNLTIAGLLPDIATCKDCDRCIPLCDGCADDCSRNLITNDLTSGYYGGEDRRLPNFAKCTHGGVFDTLSMKGINKDSRNCQYSPHFYWHNQAAALAKEATKQFIRDIKATLTPRQLKLLLGVGPTLAIAIDTTGSMGAIINSVRQQAIQTVNNRLNTDEEPSKYVLVPFNDPSVGPVTITDDPDVFKSRILFLFASGGGDCPELCLNGVLKALSASDPGGDLFVFTDADAKDASMASKVSSLATMKDINIHFMVFGNCTTGGFFAGNNSDQKSTTKFDLSSINRVVDPAYLLVANNSGGEVTTLSAFEADKVVQLADIIVRANAVRLLSINDTLSATAKTYTLPIDSLMTKVTFYISGSTSAVIKRPDGSIIDQNSPGVKFISLSNAVGYSIANPATGNWSVTISGSNAFSLRVTGESVLDLDYFKFVAERGRPGHNGFFPITGFPISGQNSSVNAKMSENFNTARFELRSEQGTVLQTLNIARGSDITANEFFGNIITPRTSFLVYVTGLDINGTAYQRVLSGIIKPQSVKIIAPTNQDLRPGQTRTYSFQVQNFGPTGTFQFSAVDDQGFLSNVSPTSFTLNTNQTLNVTVQLQPSSSVQPGTSDTLTVAIENTTTDVHNFAVVTSVVTSDTSNNAPECSQAKPSIMSLSPPNHKMVEVSIQGVTDPDNDPITIQIDRIMQDEPTNGLGDGDSCPDGQGIGTPTAQLRSERSATGNGRVYTIFFTATDGKGGSCQGSVKVCVARDQSNSICVDDGSIFDSTMCD